MTWTAKLVSVEKKDGMARATVRFESDQGDAPLTLSNFGDTFDETALKSWVYVKLASLNAMDAAFTSLAAVPVGLIDGVKPADVAILG